MIYFYIQSSLKPWVGLKEIKSTLLIGRTDAADISLEDKSSELVSAQVRIIGDKLFWFDCATNETRELHLMEVFNWRHYQICLGSLEDIFSFHQAGFLHAFDEVMSEKNSFSGYLDKITSEWDVDPIPELVMKLIDQHISELACESPIEKLLQDPLVSDVLVERYDLIWIEKSGILQASNLQFTSQKSYEVYLEKILSYQKKSVDHVFPYCDFNLISGERAHVISKPLTQEGPYLSIRKAINSSWRLKQLYELNMFSEQIYFILKSAINSKENILLSGATGSGKTTLLRALLLEIHDCERVIVVEDTPELSTNRRNTAYLQTRYDSRSELPPVGMRELVRQSLRMRPDRIIVGEVRGDEARDMIHAMNTGHRGCLSSIHANSSRDALKRLVGLIMGSGEDMSLSLSQDWIQGSLQLVVHCDRDAHGKRKVKEISWLRGYEGSQFLLETVQNE